MTFTEFLAGLLTGNNLALAGAAIAVIVAGMGSAKGVGMVGEASAGLMIRGSIDPSAPTVFLHCRPGRIMVVYRPGDKQDTLKAKEISAVIDYPVSMKLEYQNNKVICYYMQNSGKTWVKFATVPFINLNPTVCVGLSAHSTEQEFTATAKWTSFETTIDADEGYTTQDPSQGGGSGDSGGSTKPEEEQIVFSWQ